MKIIKKLLWILFLLGLTLALIAFGYYLAVTHNALLDSNKLILNNQTVTVYDQTNERIQNTSLFSTQQTVSIDNIPLHTRQAFVSTEDKRFYSHNGFDWKRIIKATLTNTKAKSFKEGASTISQQLIKNTHLSQEKTIKRKLQEWKLTRRLEKKYTKNEILEKYLNTIYFGHNCFGLRAAAEFYFQKEPQDLTLADSAILAGLLKSPNNYSPFKNPSLCQQRKETVLSLMVKNQYISQAEKAESIKAPLPIQPKNIANDASYLSFVFDELSDLAAKHRLRLGGSVEIYTGYDPALQKQVNILCEKSMDCDHSVFIADCLTKSYKACHSTVGNIRRLPGSLIKPLLVYAPALEENMISPATPILDEKVNYSGYTPENYDKKFHGYVSARQCVSKSLNVPAVKILQSLGIEKATKYLKALNLDIPKEDHSLALALGGMKNGFYLRDILSAYTALQNGIFTPYGFIERICVNGVQVYEREKINTHVFSDASAYLMTDMLKTTAKEGTAKKLHTLPFDVAAKTGTVGTKNGNTDAYALSYTTRDTVGVWLGNADNSAITHTGGGLPCNLLYEINKALHEDYLVKNITILPFERPMDVKEVWLDKISYYDTHNILLADDISPAEYRIKELFSSAAIPSKKSDFFSNPSISNPTISIENNHVLIRFPSNVPEVYKLKIERYDYVTHNTVYEGKKVPQFVDMDITQNKKYQYTVTPIYNDRIGKSITLPIVNTTTSSQENGIIQKEWWNN